MKDRLLIKNATILTFFNDGYNAVKILPVDILIENGVIVETGPDLENCDNVIDATGKLAVPGFVNGRSRCLASRLSKSIAEDMRFELYGNTPMYTRVNPFINIALDVLDDGELKAILELSLFEAVWSGTTTLMEHCSCRELPIFLELCEKYGLRTVAAPMLMSRESLPEADAWGRYDETPWELDPDKLVSWNLEIASTHSEGRVRAAMGLGAIDAVSEELMRKTAAAAVNAELLLMLPLNETRREIEFCREKYGLSPVELLQRNNVLHENTLVGGNVFSNHEDRVILRSMSCKAVSCQHQAMLDAELVPFIEFLIDDVPTIIGTGRMSVNMLKQLQISAISGKLESKKRSQMRAQDAFYAATIGGGRAAGQRLGELEPGDAADIILIDLNHPKFRPLVMPLAEVVYNTDASDISDVIVDGKPLKMDGIVTGVNIPKLIQEAEAAMEKVWQRGRDTGAL